jgi:hypothetical protein
MDAVMHQLTLKGLGCHGIRALRFLTGDKQEKAPGAQTRSSHRASRHTLTPS